jgi:hypothetical protein
LGWASTATVSGSIQFVEAGRCGEPHSGGGGEQDVSSLAASTTVNGAMHVVFSYGIALHPHRFTLFSKVCLGNFMISVERGGHLGVETNTLRARVAALTI